MRRVLRPVSFPAMAERQLESYTLPVAALRGSALIVWCRACAGQLGGELTEQSVVRQLFVPEVALGAAVRTRQFPVESLVMEKDSTPLPWLPLTAQMLAGVSYVLTMRGNSAEGPRSAGRICRRSACQLPALRNRGAACDDCLMRLRRLRPIVFGQPMPALDVPIFRHHLLLYRPPPWSAAPNGKVDGFLIEGPTGGRHPLARAGQMGAQRNGANAFTAERDRVDLRRRFADGRAVLA